MRHMKHYSGQKTRRGQRVPAAKIQGNWVALSTLAERGGVVVNKHMKEVRRIERMKKQ